MQGYFLVEQGQRAQQNQPGVGSVVVSIDKSTVQTVFIGAALEPEQGFAAAPVLAQAVDGVGQSCQHSDLQRTPSQVLIPAPLKCQVEDQAVGQQAHGGGKCVVWRQGDATRYRAGITLKYFRRHGPEWMRPAWRDAGAGLDQCPPNNKQKPDNQEW